MLAQIRDILPILIRASARQTIVKFHALLAPHDEVQEIHARHAHSAQHIFQCFLPRRFIAIVKSDFLHLIQDDIFIFEVLLPDRRHLHPGVLLRQVVMAWILQKGQHRSLFHRPFLIHTFSSLNSNR